MSFSQSKNIIVKHYCQTLFQFHIIFRQCVSLSSIFYAYQIQINVVNECNILDQMILPHIVSIPLFLRQYIRIAYFYESQNPNEDNLK